MRISERHLRDVLQAYVERLGAPGWAERRASARGPTEADSFTLSPEAAQVRRLVELLQTIPEIREERVRELAQRIESGHYDIPVESIIDALLGQGESQ